MECEEINKENFLAKLEAQTAREIENGASLLDFVKLNDFINIVLHDVINFATILIC